MNLIFIFVILFLAFSPNSHADENKMQGAVTCSAAACHGGTQKKKNEFTRWSTQDKHRKAYGVLFDERSQKMAKILGLKRPAHEDDFCLSCHGVKNDVAKSPRYDIQEGVSCESCHGAAEKWLEPHVQKEWPYEKSVRLGMTDLKDISIRTQTCLTCHSTLDHKVLAAGHPDVVFEQDTFTAMMPRHWDEKGSWAGAKAWATGQVLSLKQHLNLLEKLSREGRPYDEGFKNCFACHHNIYDVKWSLNDQSSGRASWDHARDRVLMDFLKVAFPEQYSLVQPKVQFLEQAFLSSTAKPEQLVEAAQEIKSRLDGILPQISGRPWGDVMVLNLIKTIAAEPQAALQGYHVAEQIFMALDALSIAAQKEGVAVSSLRGLVKKMATTLDIQDPSRYDPQAFQKVLEEMKLFLAKGDLSQPAPSQKKFVNPKGIWGKTK